MAPWLGRNLLRRGRRDPEQPCWTYSLFLALLLPQKGMGKAALQAATSPSKMETLKVNTVRVWGKNIKFFPHVSLTPCSTSCLNTQSNCTGHINKKKLCLPLSEPSLIASEDSRGTVAAMRCGEVVSHQKRRTSWGLSPATQGSLGLSNTYRGSG